MSCIYSPSTTNVIHEPSVLANLHQKEGSASDDGRSNSCAKLMGKRFGVVLDGWLSRWVQWLVGAAVVAKILQACFPRSLIVLIINVFAKFPLFVVFTLCLRVSVLKRLLTTPTVWYYILAIISGRIATMFINGVRFSVVDGEINAQRLGLYGADQTVTGLGLISSIPCIDAAPSRIAPQRVRVLHIYACANAYTDVLTTACTPIHNTRLH